MKEREIDQELRLDYIQEEEKLNLVSNLENRLKESEEKYLRLLAEFDNFKKRSAKEKENISNNITTKILSSILDIDNDISMAIKTIDDPGIKLIANKLTTFLKSHGIEEIQTSHYDQDLHEVISMVSGEENKVVDVITKGYTINGKPFRYPKVVISKNA